MRSGKGASASQGAASLHGEIVARLRDFIVEGSLKEGDRIPERDLAELFDVMGGLEALAGRLACESITDDEIAEVERLHYAMYGSYLRRDMHGYFQFNQMIHQKIVHAARNSVLQTTYTAMTNRLRRARFSANTSRNRDRWSEAMREHEEILDALRRRAGPELGEILFRHLRNKRNAVSSKADDTVE